ncbi:MAG: ROK family protein [Deltaproteobacteria bacterium]|nr:ROK family protein [Deltaproteobacteria bacterium]
MLEEKDKNSAYLSVDLGGSSLRLALLNSQGEILKRQCISSQKVQEAHDLIEVLKEELRTLIAIAQEKKLSIKAISLGIPGLVNFKEGIVYRSPHFPHWKRIPISSELKKAFDIPIFIDNDANQAALAEANLGAGKNWQDFILLTLGTGIGGAIIHQKKLFHGSHGFAGEFGHMVINPQGEKGALNISGTLESYCSMTGLRQQILSHHEKLKAEQKRSSLESLQLENKDFPQELTKMALNAEPEALKIWQNFGKNLAYGLSNLSHSFGIFKFILGGGIAKAWDFFIPTCQITLKDLVYDYTGSLIEIHPAVLGVDAGLIGGVFVIDNT